MRSITSVLGFGWAYMRRYWVRLLAGIAFSLIFAVSNANFVWATRTLAERFAPAKPAKHEVAAAPAKMPSLRDRFSEVGRAVNEKLEPWLPRAGEPLTTRQMLGLILFFPLLVAIRSVADYLSGYCIGWVAERVVRDIRLDVMEKLSTLSLSFFTRSTSGDLLTRINVDSQNLMRALRTGGADLLKESITVAAVPVALFWLDWKLTLATLVLLPLCMFPLILLGKKARHASAASLKANIDQSSQLVELISGIRVIKAFCLEHAEMDRFRKSSGRLLYAGMRGVRAKELVNPIIEIISMFGLGMLLIYIFKTGRSGAELVAFLAGVLLFFLPIKKLAGVQILFDSASVSVDRLTEILNEKPALADPPQPKPLPRFSADICFENVSFAYAEKEVLRGFNLTIPRGMKLGVAGESGSGKTTIVNLLLRFYDPTQGTLRFDGMDFRDARMSELRAQMALVSQEVVLFDQTVAENIGCGKTGASRAEIEAAAKAAFAHEFITQLPESYDTRVGERGVTLSGGQRQRIAIARAFVRDAPILVLDEATASLDSKAEAEVQAAIDRLAEHRTVVCVAHRLSTLSGMDRIVVLSDGRMIESGGFNELLEQRGAFAQMAARQGIVPAGVR